ncbi:serine/threonine/tyrosine-protein kinase HT1-like [Oryza brachyantha]|uniref:serine/threonine/tyrosine-protein kinase HT1-like n=1 Tax=Oryza brachyantha TaxID=4533 RepID=UPI001ADCF079|nr:serine/threonine/tyrosine-protein kinase HT1-like [Oryza brachyantha]
MAGFPFRALRRSAVSPLPPETEAAEKRSGNSLERVPARSAVAAEPWAADRSKLRVGPKIASGANSRVYRGDYAGQAVAVKMMRETAADGDLRQRREVGVGAQFDAEVTLLWRLRHPNVVRLVAACREPPSYCVVTELMAGGALGAYLRGREPNSLPPEDVVRLALGVARGMECLHARGVVHRDLKPQNLLLDGGARVVKVADLGTSCLEATCRADRRPSRTGTYRWMAPEMIRDHRCDRKVDVYSFGLVLWELTTCLVPFQDLSPVQAAYAVTNAGARPPLSPSCPPAINTLIERCWSAKPEKRPEFKDIVQVLESYDRCLREGLPLLPLPLPLPLPAPAPLASLIGAFKIRSCRHTDLEQERDASIQSRS